MSTGYAARFRACRVAVGNKVRDPGSREHNRAVAAANSPDKPDSAVRLKAANRVATSKAPVNQAARRVDVRLDNEE
jgi:hypothetical protein